MLSIRHHYILDAFELSQLNLALSSMNVHQVMLTALPRLGSELVSVCDGKQPSHRTRPIYLYYLLVSPSIRFIILQTLILSNDHLCNTRKLVSSDTRRAIVNGIPDQHETQRRLLDTLYNGTSNGTHKEMGKK